MVLLLIEEIKFFMKGAHLLPQAYDASVDILISSLTCTKIVTGDREEGGI